MLGLIVLVKSMEGIVPFREGSESVYVELRGSVYRHPILDYGHMVIELTLNDDNLLSQEIIRAVVTSYIRLVQD